MSMANGLLRLRLGSAIESYGEFTYPLDLNQG